jgi:hypothetical protein
MTAHDVVRSGRNRLDEEHGRAEVAARDRERMDGAGEPHDRQIARSWRPRGHKVEADRHATACVPQDAWVVCSWA